MDMLLRNLLTQFLAIDIFRYANCKGVLILVYAINKVGKQLVTAVV